MISETPDMEPINLGYSFKNIPPCNRRMYMTRIFETTYRLVEKMRWKAYYFDKNGEEDDEPSTPEYTKGVFPSRYSAPVNKYLEDFEKDLYKMIKKR